ncbi:hypothetical protein GCM10009639_48390 [Kitasatospora putterlickiae]|uniref:Peptidase inhibitor family I36 n=1 Tax=Kitasatospora putterlickiae TaxID=221725 RepID=A0ABN1YBT5_9ACTN
MNVKRIVATAAILATGLGTAVATAPAASAATIGTCTYNYACLFYNSSNYNLGAQFQHESDINDYAGAYFSAGQYGSSGAGVEVKNHAASVANGDRYWQVTIWERSGTTPWGNHNIIRPGAFADLGVVKNDNAAGTWQYAG